MKTISKTVVDIAFVPEKPSYPRGVAGRWPILPAGKVAEALDVPRRRVLTYVEYGLVELPDVSPGTGNNRMFSYFNLLSLASLETLYAIGYTSAKMRGFAGDVAKAWNRHLEHGPVDTAEILPGKPTGTGQPLAVIVLRLTAIEAEVFEALQRVAPDYLSGEDSPLEVFRTVITIPQSVGTVASSAKTKQE